MDKAMLDFYSNVILSSFSLFDSNKRICLDRWHDQP